MKVLLICFAILCLAFSMSGSPSKGELAEQKLSNIIGWEELSWGMSLSQIKEKMRDSIMELPEGKKFKNSYSKYVLKNYKVSDYSFTVYFQMDGRTHKLSQIIVQFLEKDPVSPKQEMFDRISNHLVAQHGKFTLIEDSSEPSRIDHKIKWTYPSTIIELHHYFNKRLSLNLITISYYPNEKKIKI